MATRAKSGLIDNTTTEETVVEETPTVEVVEETPIVEEVEVFNPYTQGCKTRAYRTSPIVLPIPTPIIESENGGQE